MAVGASYGSRIEHLNFILARVIIQIFFDIVTSFKLHFYQVFFFIAAKKLKNMFLFGRDLHS